MTWWRKKPDPATPEPGQPVQVRRVWLPLQPANPEPLTDKGRHAAVAAAAAFRQAALYLDNGNIFQARHEANVAHLYLNGLIDTVES